MKYRVLQRLSYNGRIYNKDEYINVLDMYVESLLKRGLIEENKETKESVKEEVKEPVKETEATELTATELSKLNKDKLIELATSKGIAVDEELTKKEIIALILGD